MAARNLFYIHRASLGNVAASRGWLGRMERLVERFDLGPLADIPPTGRRAEVVACNVVEVRDGRIYREREFFDSLSLMQQLGVADA